MAFPKLSKNRIFFLTFLFFVSIRLHRRFDSKDLTVTFFDVGQGDAALVQFPLGKTLLIDAGGGWKEWDIGSRVLFGELTRLSILTLDYLLLSHPDQDHAYGFLGILKKLSAKEFWLHGNLSPASSQPQTSRPPILTEIEKLMKEKSVTPRWFSKPEKLFLSGTTLEIVPLGSQSQTKKRNDQALVAKLSFGKCHILFTGDIEKKSENEWLQQDPDKIHLLKVPHHGSLTSSQWHFLNRLRPQWAVVSVGLKNRYGHPKKTILERYRWFGTSLLRTDFHGAVRFTFSPSGDVKCETVRGDCGISRCE